MLQQQQQKQQPPNGQEHIGLRKRLATNRKKETHRRICLSFHISIWLTKNRWSVKWLPPCHLNSFTRITHRLISYSLKNRLSRKFPVHMSKQINRVDYGCKLLLTYNIATSYWSSNWPGEWTYLYAYWDNLFLYLGSYSMYLLKMDKSIRKYFWS